MSAPWKKGLNTFHGNPARENPAKVVKLLVRYMKNPTKLKGAKGIRLPKMCQVLVPGRRF